MPLNKTLQTIKCFYQNKSALQQDLFDSNIACLTEPDADWQIDAHWRLYYQQKAVLLKQIKPELEKSRLGVLWLNLEWGQSTIHAMVNPAAAKAQAWVGPSN